ncbi:hypothetical protein Slu03_27500 [Sediminihabitans luteus]|nr:hypothetical protein Slu03_27500 [Sediminihabitans luteus]
MLADVVVDPSGVGASMMLTSAGAKLSSGVVVVVTAGASFVSRADVARWHCGRATRWWDHDAPAGAVVAPCGRQPIVGFLAVRHPGTVPWSGGPRVVDLGERADGVPVGTGGRVHLRVVQVMTCALLRPGNRCTCP